MSGLIPEINGIYNQKEGEYRLPKRISAGEYFPVFDAVFISRAVKAGLCEEGKTGAHPAEFVYEEADPEGYRLEIDVNKVTVYTGTESGYSNALVSLYILLLQGGGKTPCCTISDRPRFAYRGFMLDVCRHFYGAEEVKKILEQCALLKLNKFHWHLSNDQGFRLESKKFPILNEVSSFRTLSEQDILVQSGKKHPGDRYGGYYTKEEIRSVLSFAKERNIEVVPEIEMPGHSMAILAAYPELSCDGNPVDVAADYGIHDTVFCAGKENVYEFLKQLLDEVISLFPSEYIHLGGDEVPKAKWSRCSACAEKMKTQGCGDCEQLQGYFINRVIKDLDGKTPIVWNESLAGGNLEARAIVQYWFEMTPNKKVSEEVLKGSRKFILSSMNHFYCDYSYAEVPMIATLQYEPEISGDPLSEERVLGIEAPLWTEWIADCETLEKMIWPRLAAVAECAWTKGKNYKDFLSRLKKLTAIPFFNQLRGETMENATVCGQKALDTIVCRMKELSQKLGRLSQKKGGENYSPEQQMVAVAAVKTFIYNKMKDAYTEKEISYVQKKLIDILS